MKTPLCKGFNDFIEVLDYSSRYLGLNYYIFPALRENPEKIQQYKIHKDKDKVIFCDNYNSMTKGFKRLNAKCEALSQEKDQLLMLLKKETIIKGTQTADTCSPSQNKMDESGVHSPLNINRPTVSSGYTTSPIQNDSR